MSYILVTASSNEARDRLNKVFNGYAEDEKVSKLCSRAYLVENNGKALEHAYREQLRNEFGVDIFFVEELHDRDIPDKVKKNAEWHINNANSLPQQKNKAIENNELEEEEELEKCQPKIRATRNSEEKQ